MRRIGLTRACGARLVGMISALALSAAVSSASAQQTEPSAPLAQAPAGASETSAPAAATAPKSGVQPAPAAKPAILKSAGADESTRATMTKYSHKQKNGGGMSAAASVTSGTPGVPAPNSVLCQAGCDQQPGEIVHVQEAVLSPPVVALAAAQADSTAAPDTIACIGGCDSGGSIFAGVPNGIESTYVTTQGKLPGASKPTSGEWMTRINRERTPDLRR